MSYDIDELEADGFFQELGISMPSVTMPKAAAPDAASAEYIAAAKAAARAARVALAPTPAPAPAVSKGTVLPAASTGRVVLTPTLVASRRPAPSSPPRPTSAKPTMTRRDSDVAQPTRGKPADPGGHGVGRKVRARTRRPDLLAHFAHVPNLASIEFVSTDGEVIIIEP